MPKRDNPYAALNKLFHEPNRLAIVSALCNATEGITFNELKQECNLTDGNLSRHLRSLQHARIIRIRKTFVQSKPQTTIYFTERGRDSFVRYLEALEEVLLKAAESLGGEKSTSNQPLQKPARA
ncbi:transcriptional regulator [bacterium]|nr:transcriptional regulator [bacterium]MCI0602579.1 transcriptional regulator [bacterium]